MYWYSNASLKENHFVEHSLLLETDTSLFIFLSCHLIGDNTTFSGKLLPRLSSICICIFTLNSMLELNYSVLHLQSAFSFGDSKLYFKVSCDKALADPGGLSQPLISGALIKEGMELAE